jgi:hypothetical protein
MICGSLDAVEGSARSVAACALRTAARVVVSIQPLLDREALLRNPSLLLSLLLALPLRVPLLLLPLLLRRSLPVPLVVAVVVVLLLLLVALVALLLLLEVLLLLPRLLLLALLLARLGLVPPIELAAGDAAPPLRWC